MSRLPIRARLTVAFAGAMVLVLLGAALFVFLRLRADLDETVNAGLSVRADAVAALAERSTFVLDEGGPGATEDPEDGFAQVVAPDGHVIDSVGGASGPVLDPAETQQARDSHLLIERSVQGVEGTARILARPASNVPGGPIVVVGQSLEDRDETLAGVVASFGIGGPLAVLLASVIGYGLATAGLAPVEAMRRRAADVSLSRGEERLPLPAARDELHRLGTTLNQMLDRLRRSFERERRFVADASHELRSPIAVIKTELDGALRTGDYGPDVREALVAAVDECDHLAQLAEDLLVLARASEGRLPVRRERIDASRLLDGVRERFADRAAQQGRALRVDAPEGLDLPGDPLRLRQALGNLVDNALRHGGGEVALRARSADGGVDLEVLDEGAGFASGIAAGAFERFARGDAARTRGGAGLGLAIVRAVAEAHGGEATIVPGAGATVRIWLPTDDRFGGTPSGGRSPPALRSAGMSSRT